MRYYRLYDSYGEPRLCVETERGVLSDLTSLEQEVAAVEDLALAASLAGLDIDAVANNLLRSDSPETYDLFDIIEDSRKEMGDLRLDLPFDPPEVWAAGVTYKASEMERRRESGTPDIYSRVYAAGRPELFFKATAERCVGPFESIGIRADSSWSVPEPELAIVLFGGEIIGYTIGNDVSSRSIEGENPLYLPQAKVYDRCCSIGPCFVSAKSLANPYNLAIACAVVRGVERVFSGETSTSFMNRRCPELAEWLQRHNSVPNMTTMLTGTAIVPPPDFTLQEGDMVTISIEGIGTLENDVVEV